MSPPSIELNGDDSLVVYTGGEFTEPGFNATDGAGVPLDVSVTGEVDLSTSGTYTLTYAATDSAGNTTEITRAVTVRAPSMTISFVDSNPMLMEGSYTHRFEFVFDDTEATARTLSISVAGRSSAEERVDFELLTDLVTVPEGSEGGFVEIRVLDDRLPEGLEEIELEISDDQGKYLSSFDITLDDRTSPGVRHGDISSALYDPSAVVSGDDVLVIGPSSVERYNLISETTTARFVGFRGVQTSHPDAVAYDERIFVFGGTKLYEVDPDTLTQSLVSDSAPLSLRWNSEIQAIDDKLYIVGGRPIDSYFSDEVLVFDLTSEEWEIVPSINRARYGAATAVSDNTLYVFGGNGGNNSAEAYNLIARDSRVIRVSDVLGRSFSTAVNLGEYVFITVNGGSSSGTSTVVRFDPNSESFNEFTIDIRGASRRDSFLYKGRTYLLGGSNQTTTFGRQLYSYYIGD